MTIFEEKIATLTHTVQMGEDGSCDLMAAALTSGANRPAIAIGSGGSAIMAEFFARCRSTLGLGTTVVQTPMEFVVAQDDWSGFDIWLFSAGADNPDVRAAFATAIASAANTLLVTVNAEGATARAAKDGDRAQLIVAPVAEKKDGFLATHSLVAMVSCTLAACNSLANRTGRAAILHRYAQTVDTLINADQSMIPGFRPGDTVMVLHDPQCRTLATLIETSLWETGIAPVQKADFRNFAHGRHVWAARHPDSMYVIAITTAASKGIWQGIRDALPDTIRGVDFDLEHAGRFRTAVSVVEGLLMVQALGAATDTDPGRPGRGEFAGAIYGDDGLVRLAERLDPAVRHKIEAVQLHDDPSCPITDAGVARRQWLDAMSNARIGGIVLDYDGTVVTTADRLKPPAAEIVTELTRLGDAGIAIAFATGRGGSAGEALRDVLPARMHHQVTVGYYNGGHIRSLDVDIEKDQPAANADLAAVAELIEDASLLQPGVNLKRGMVQITINHSDITAPAAFVGAVSAFPPVAEGRIRTVSSHHSFDLLPADTTKMSVAAHLRRSDVHDLQILAIGDSGEPGGNDSDMLARPPSISVDGVCSRLDGSWSLFGRSVKGPAALLRILRAMRVEGGHARLDIAAIVGSPA